MAAPTMRPNPMGRRLALAALLVLTSLLSGCGRKATPTSQATAPKPTATIPAETQQATRLTRAQIDAIIAPLPEKEKADIARSLPQWISWTDRLRALYASLPEAKRQDMQTKGRCEIKLADLTDAQAKVVNDLLAQDPDRNLRQVLEQWTGKPLDLTKLTFVFTHDIQGIRGDVFLGFRGSGGEYTPAPIGILPGK
jgi:hypothetical protein